MDKLLLSVRRLFIVHWLLLLKGAMETNMQVKTVVKIEYILSCVEIDSLNTGKLCKLRVISFYYFEQGVSHFKIKEVTPFF